MAYRFRLTFTTHPRKDVETYLEKLPGLTRQGNLFLLIDEEEGVTVEIASFGDDDTIDSLVVIVPTALSPQAAARIAAFCVTLASRFHWAVREWSSVATLSEGDIAHRLSKDYRGTASKAGCLSALAVVVLAVFMSHSLLISKSSTLLYEPKSCYNMLFVN